MSATARSATTGTLSATTTSDYYWGCGTEGTGKNRLGELLMETREGYTP